MADQSDCPMNQVVVFSDVVNFTRYTLVDQKRIAEHMWLFLKEFFEEHNDAFQACSINGLGDGVLLAFDRVGVLCVIEMCQRWIAHMHDLHLSDGRVHIRTAIHAGQFMEYETGINSDKGCEREVIGSAINECSRMVSIGDADHIIVSDYFACEARKLVGFAKFDPGLGDYPARTEPPYEVSVKHGEVVKVRLINIGGVNPKAPKKIINLQQIDRQLRMAVQDVGQLLTGFLNDNGIEGSASDLGLRVSIFVYDDQKLKCSAFRYCFHHQEFRAEGKTVYEIHQQGDGLVGEGPVGEAFVKKECVFVNNLPEWHEGGDNTEYKQKLGSIPPAKIDDFSRKARCYMAIPVGTGVGLYEDFEGDDKTREGVVCVDMDHPCDQLEPERLQILLEGIRSVSASLIALLLRQRIV